MFGKGRKKMSSTAKFIMGAGRAAGNLKAMPKGGKPVRGDKGAPMPDKNRKPSPGQFDTFKTRGK